MQTIRSFCRVCTSVCDITIHDVLSSRVSVQYTPAVVDPVGERRSMWWVFAELGRRLGYDMGNLGSGH